MFCFLTFSAFFFLGVMCRGLILSHYLFFFALRLIVVLFLRFFLPSAVGFLLCLRLRPFSSSGMLRYQSRKFPSSACLFLLFVLSSLHHLLRLVFLPSMLSAALLSLFLRFLSSSRVGVVLGGAFSFSLSLIPRIVCFSGLLFCFALSSSFSCFVFLVGVVVLVSAWVLFLVLALVFI